SAMPNRTSEIFPLTGDHWLKIQLFASGHSQTCLLYFCESSPTCRRNIVKAETCFSSIGLPGWLSIRKASKVTSKLTGVSRNMAAMLGSKLVNRPCEPQKDMVTRIDVSIAFQVWALQRA